MEKPIVIGSRGSELALWQANFILTELKEINIQAQIKIIKTQGDKVQHLSFDKLEGKGFFTKELEEALLSKEIDLAVHSHKDLPTESPQGLVIAAVSYREDPSEILLIRKEAVDEKQKFSFKKNAVVGTSSARRKSQLLAFRSDIELKELRGNVPTRIQKLRDGAYDAIMLAAAGLERLGIDLDDFFVEKLSPKEFTPAPAQGVLAIQIREKDHELAKRLSAIHHLDVAETIAIERKVLNLFDGGCQLPLGVYCEKEENDEGEEKMKVWVTKAEAWNTFPKYFYFESKKTDGLAEKIVKKINNIIPCTVFVSRDQRKNDLLFNALTAAGYNVFMRSLIETKIIPIKKLPATNWIFFSSKNAVKYFFDQQPQLGLVKYAAVGKATSEELRKYGKRADFIGYSTDTRLTGKQFAAVVGSGTVLFPQAKGSMKTIQQQFTKPGQMTDLTVYETIKQNSEVPSAEIIVFTSPSNVEAFFEKNKITKEQKVVAMGDATANALRKYNLKANKMPVSFDDMGLAQAIFSV